MRAQSGRTYAATLPGGRAGELWHDGTVSLLVLHFIVVPAVELALLIEVGRRIGTLNTLALIAITGVIGASLAGHQGLQVLHQVRRDLAAGRLPAGALLDGVLILVAAALLVTPGILTDAVGLLCLVPGFRVLIKRRLRRRFERAVRGKRIHVVTYGSVSPRERPGDDRRDDKDSDAPPLLKPRE